MEAEQKALRPEEQIKLWTKEDYQTSVAPYEWLYGFKDNPFQLERLRGLMLEDAKQKRWQMPVSFGKSM